MELLLGDCLDRLKDLEDNSIDAIVTDPPYGLSFMGKKWDYDVPSVDIWKECLRVLKPGGYLLSFAGTRTQHRMAVNIEDAGFEIRDMIAWVYGSGFPKSLNIGKAIDKMLGNERELISVGGKCGVFAHAGDGREQDINNYQAVTTKGNSEWEGWGTALKPALEPITVARKPLGEKTVAENCLKWGVGGINIDGCRVGTEGITTNGKGKQDGNTPIVPQSPDFVGETHIGRFPANLIHDGSDEVVGLFPQNKSTANVRHNKASENTCMSGKNYERDGYGYSDSGSAARFFYCAKASKRERNIGCEGLEKKVGVGNFMAEAKWINDPRSPNGGYEAAPSKPQSNSHPTVKPLALMEYLVKLVSREGQVVLDPFMGSGTTGMACKKLDREFIGIEMMPEYMEIAQARIEGVKKGEQLNML
jgi:site-specific DNA-methyltransferase (adenine-specific)